MVTRMALMLVIGMGVMEGAQIVSPDANYLARTKYVDPTASTENFEMYDSVTNNGLTVHFSASMSRLTVNDPSSFGGWGTWSAAPESQRETSTTAFPLFYAGGSLSVDLTFEGVTLFGLEAQPNRNSFNFDITVSFFSGSTQIGTITRNVSASGGARLFAWESTQSQKINKVTVSMDDDFAIGGMRYAGGNEIPEPGSIALLGSGIGLILIGSRKWID